MPKYSSTWKNCATCMSWNGIRKLDAFKTSVDVDSNAEGICYGRWKNSKKKFNHSCSGWLVWGVLKK